MGTAGEQPVRDRPSHVQAYMGQWIVSYNLNQIANCHCSLFTANCNKAFPCFEISLLGGEFQEGIGSR